MFRERFNRYDGIVSLLPLPLSPLGSLPLASKRGGLPCLYPLMKSETDKSLALLLPEVRDCPRYTGVSIQSVLNDPPLPSLWSGCVEADGWGLSTDGSGTARARLSFGGRGKVDRKGD